MGLLSWFWGNSNSTSTPSPSPSPPKPTNPKDPSSPKLDHSPEEVPGMNGAVEVQRRRREELAVFEFGSAGAGGVTMAGYCPVSEDLQPCHWEILPAPPGSDAPQFRIVF